MALESLKRLTRSRALTVLPEQTRALIQRIPKPVQLQMRHYSRRSMLILFEVFVGMLIVAFVAVALVKSQLQQGPISLSFMVLPLERAINRELPGLSVDIEDFVLKQSDNRSGLEFRMMNIQVNDERGNVVAQAPLAAIGLSGRSLLSGRLAPGSVDLIGAQLRLFYKDDTGLALSFARPDPLGDLLKKTKRQPIVKLTHSKLKAETIAERQLASNHFKAQNARKIDLLPVIYDTFEEARRRPGVSTYLTRFGFRNALVAFDLEGVQSVWKVPNFSLDLEHKKKRSIIRGITNIKGQDRDWNIRFQTEQSEKRKDLIFTLLFDDIVPRDVSEHFSQLKLFSALDLPLKGQASITVTRTGNIKSAEADLSLGAGHVVTFWQGAPPLSLDEGAARVRYDRQARIIEVLPSKFRWGKSQATLSGEIHTQQQSGGDRWNFSFKANNAVLAAEEFAVSVAPVQEWSASGYYSRVQKQIRINDYRLILPNGGMQFAGTVTEAPGSPEIIGEGTIAAHSAETLKRLWTPLWSPMSRQWVGHNLERLNKLSGNFKIAMPGGVLAASQSGGEIPSEAASAKMQIEGLELRYLETMPQLKAPKAVLNIRGRKLLLDAPRTVVELPSGGKVETSLAQFRIDDLRPNELSGVIEIKTNASLANTLELLDHKPFEVLKISGIAPNTFRGDVSAAFRVNVPLETDTRLTEITVNGLAKVRRLKAQKLFGDVSLEGGSVDFGLSGSAIDARGDILLNGVPAKISWQRIFGGDSTRQPAVRISGIFDDSGRRQLGLPTDKLIKGDVEAQLSITNGSDGQRKMHLEADLTNSRLEPPKWGWQKPAGRTAKLQFDIVPLEGGRTELRNFQIYGDKVAVNGWLRFDKQGALYAYAFPEVSYDVASRLEIAGLRDRQGIWKVTARSSTYDGRRFFRSLFSGGQFGGDTGRPDEDGKSLDFDGRFDTVIGHFDGTVHDLTVKLKKREGRLVQFSSLGKFPNGKLISAEMNEQAGRPRVITAKSDDAGSAFRLVGFYPRIIGGFSKLDVNLDGKDAATTVGTLDVRDFALLGEPVVTEAGSSSKRTRKKQPVQYQKIDFDRMRVPFSVGFGQFVLHNSQINGPLLGATMRGHIDFDKDRMDLGGTYVPLFGLNAIPGEIPILGNILIGRRGEGLLGVTFAVQGSIAKPQVIVNPVSVAAPGIFRQIFEMSPQSPKLRRRKRKPPPPGN